MPANLLNRRAFVAAVASLPAARFLQAQEPTFSAGVKVVNVFATVRNKKGEIVKDLEKEDFTLLEDGRPQTIRYFTRQSDLPLTLGLLVDTSMSERGMIGTERTASYKFLEQVLRPDRDKAFLIHFDHDVELLQDLTSSRERLEKALDELKIGQPDEQAQGQQGGGGYPGGGGGMGYPGGGGRHQRGGGGPRRSHGSTALYDGVYLAADEILSKQTGRKALILLTDGEDRGSKTSLEEAIISAQRADTLGYAVRIANDEIGSMAHGWNGGSRGGGDMDRPDGKKVLKQIATRTGGAYFEYGKKKPLEDIYAEIQDELRNQYSIGYTSDHPGADQGTGDKGFRKIEVTVGKKGLVVQARDGYYA
jgi:VWFA-related protein